MYDENYQSTTYIPYYDKITTSAIEADNEYCLIDDDDLEGIDKSKKKKQKEHEEEKDKLAIKLPGTESLVRFVPIKERSYVITETQSILIARRLPPLFRMKEWKRLYCMDEDGVSYQTFYNNAKDHSNTILLIMDALGSRFGAYCTEDWAVHKHFYGTGESFLFTFKDTKEDI
jgi:hypothetical protein